MPELRKDPITGRWVIIATDRAKRPSDFIRQPVVPPAGGMCPFDYGNEQRTPPEVLAYRNGGGRDQPGWRVRVVPNKFPALGIEGELNREGFGAGNNPRTHRAYFGSLVNCQPPAFSTS